MNQQDGILIYLSLWRPQISLYMHRYSFMESEREGEKEEERYIYRMIQLYYIDLGMNPEDGILIYLSLWSHIPSYTTDILRYP